MKLTLTTQVLSICFLACLLASPATAYWDSPIFLSELNDFENSFVASRPTISADENTLFFVRKMAPDQTKIWEAHRNPDTGVFDQQRPLTELKCDGKVWGAWMSEDNQRLYYSAADPSTWGWKKQALWMATRNNTNQTWVTVKLFSELEVEKFLTNCSLTADEKIIFYEAEDHSGGGIHRIFTASRSNISEPFGTPQELFELEAIEALSPTMTPDGLTVFFGRAIDPINTGIQELWVGHRASIDEAFTDFRPLNEINSLGHSVMGWFSSSWDGQRLYYHQRNGEPGNWNIETTGIFVSSWVDPPEVVVDKNLVSLIEEKTAIVDQLAAAIEKEVETLNILETLQELTNKGSEEFRAIQKTKIHIHKALQNEILAQSKINSSIYELQKALSAYRMEEQPPCPNKQAQKFRKK